MMLNVFDVAEILVAWATAEHGGEIDIIGYYGSHAQGAATSKSDLDIFYIPSEGKNPPVGRTFLLEDMLFDFWGIRWNTMEGFATGRIRGWSFAPAIVHHAKPIYSRSEEQAARFAALKQQVLDLQKPEARPEMVRRALAMFPNVQMHLANVIMAAVSGDLADIRHAGWKLILSVWECLTLVNQTFSNRDNILGEIPRLQIKPANLEELITKISTSIEPAEIAFAANQLAADTRTVLREIQESFSSEQTVQDQFKEAYPELKDAFRKVLSACERKRPVAASKAAWSVQRELSEMLYGLRNSSGHTDFNLYSQFSAAYCELGFPDLTKCALDDLPKLAEQTKLLDERLRQWLLEHSVSLQEYETVEDLKLWLTQMD